MAKSRRKKNARRAKRNLKRAERKAELLGPGRTRQEWLREVVGEPPVILDTALVSKSRKQLETFLVKKGYFQNTVTDSIAYFPKKRMAKVYYNLKAEEPYFIDSVGYRIEDERLRQYVFSPKSPRTLKEGERFDVAQLAAERENLTDVMRNSGYYYFSREYVYFQVDSTIGDRKVDVIYRVENPSTSVDGFPDSLITSGHEQYKIDKIYFSYVLAGKRIVSDTVAEGDYTFVNSSVFPLKRKVIVQNTFLRKGALYQQDKVELTYRRLSALPVISHVAIRFVQVEGQKGKLDVYIDLVPARRQNLSFETKGTNSGGFLGLQGDAVYRHKNIFKGAETMEIHLTGGIQSQSLLTDNTSTDPDAQQEDNLGLNTTEFGPSVSFTIPKFLIPIRSEKFAQSINPSTVINTGYNFQLRPDYQRSLANIFVGYAWNESPRKRHQVNPIEVSIIQIDKSDEFQARLDELNDKFLSDSYQNHFITSTSYTFTFNDNDRLSKKNALYYRGNMEVSGNILRAAYSLSGAQLDDQGSYKIFDLRFSNFVKTNNDFRFYRNFSERSALAFRVAGGIGVPLKNLNVLPFSKSFFSGGANGLRAWRSRTIGPGGFFEPAVTYDKIGDIQLETSLEYRFNLIDYIEGAFFMDAGNIWLLKADDLRPEGHFQGSEFLSQVAVGGGFGLRLDFDYFLIRFDLAGQLKDPSLVKGERWVFQPKDRYNDVIDIYNQSLGDGEKALDDYRLRLNFNLGIGYPF